MYKRVPYVPPSRKYREARAVEQMKDRMRAQKEMPALGFCDADIREELERIASESYNPFSSETPQ